jgi:hypothetical protein
MSLVWIISPLRSCSINDKAAEVMLWWSSSKMTCFHIKMASYHITFLMYTLFNIVSDWYIHCILRTHRFCLRQFLVESSGDLDTRRCRWPQLIRICNLSKCWYRDGGDFRHVCQLVSNKELFTQVIFSFMLNLKEFSGVVGYKIFEFII